ncbi:hypothetical protein KSP39_PZI020835 [Platanthera zijinensis]|uniref:Uncharacterized protein n=1 Tax=Platanthera zijinensis TaxID=2320716 RepID=A0AAP0B0G3_9ASPA
MPWLLSCNANDSCCYTRHHQNLISQAIDVHEISNARSIVRILLSYTGILLFLVNCYILLVKVITASAFCSSSLFNWGSSWRSRACRAFLDRGKSCILFFSLFPSLRNSAVTQFGGLLWFLCLLNLCNTSLLRKSQ